MYQEINSNSIREIMIQQLEISRIQASMCERMNLSEKNSAIRHNEIVGILESLTGGIDPNLNSSVMSTEEEMSIRTDHDRA